MADIRCPMCGRPNPPDREVCGFCQARLKPMLASPFSGEGAQVPQGETPALGNVPEEEPSIPDWLRDLRRIEDTEGESAPQEELPDWLAGKPGETFPHERESSAGEVDWLRDLRGREQELPLEPEESSQHEGALWEQAASEEEPALPGLSQGEEQPEKVDQEQELPDWLKALSSDDFPGSVAGQEEESPGETAPETPSEGYPDWFSQIREAPAQDAVTPDETTPSWLAGFGAQEQDDFPWTDPAAAGEQESPLPLEGEESMPDWLKKLEPGPSNQPSGSGVPAFIMDEETVLPFDQEQGHEEQEGEAETAGEEEASPYLSTLPEWISQVTTEGESAEDEPVEEEDLGLAPAQLPNWLEAMRPVETAAPAAPLGEDQAAQVEKVGPLAGLRGVLLAEPLVGHLRKPPAYSVKLQVSETQNRNALLLQKLLESEGQAQDIPVKTAIPSQAVLRLVITVALILAVVVPLWLNSQGLPLPDPTYVPDGVAETIGLIDALGPDEPVLLAVDYEPGLSAEMDAAATTIVNGIAGRGASLALVSTNPMGPLLTERLMGTLAGSDPASPIEYTNLGFIPGGQAGLLGFASNPRSMLPYDLGNTARPASAGAWSTGALENIRSVADFAMLVVLTENPDTARDWIEQVQPFLRPGNVPLVMIVSAQAEPMVRPYFDAYPPQVNGLVAGLNGIATYENISGQSGPVRTYWDAFGAGLLVIEALILVGGLINILLALLMPRKGAEVEGTP